MKGKSRPLPAFDTLLGQLCERYAASPLPRFLGWWRDELLAQSGWAEVLAAARAR